MLEAIRKQSQYGISYSFKVNGQDVKHRFSEECFADLPLLNGIDLAIEIAELISDSSGVKVSGKDVEEALTKAGFDEDIKRNYGSIK
jgi:hypothetical protein